MDAQTALQFQLIQRHLETAVVLLAVLCILAAIVTVLSVVNFVSYTRSSCGPRAVRKFGEKAQKLLLAGEYGELLELARSRMRESPGDVGPHYYVGVANYRVGAYREAEEAFEKVLEIDPGWQPGVQAYLERCRKKGSQEDGEAYRGGCRRRQAQPGVTEPAEGDYGLATEDTEAKENGQEIGVRGQGSAVRRSLSHAAPVLRPLSVTSVPSVAALPLTC